MKKRTPTLNEIIERLKPKTFAPEPRQCPHARAYTRCTSGWHVAMLDNGVEEAIERCPDYWQKEGRRVDARDGRRLEPVAGDSDKRRGAMVDILRGKR